MDRSVGNSSELEDGKTSDQELCSRRAAKTGAKLGHEHQPPVAPHRPASKTEVSLPNNHAHGVLWDMDGVLVDTGDLHYQSWSQILPPYGIDIDRARFQPTFGMNNAGVLAALWPKPQ